MATTAPKRTRAPARKPAAHVNPRAVETVTVASKLPHGLIIRLHRMEDFPVRKPDGSTVMEKRAVEIDNTRVEIKGANSLLQEQPKMPMGVPFVLTHGVPKDIWDAWMFEFRDSDMVRNGLIFAASTTARADDQAKEQKGIRTGFEAIDPAHPEKHQPRIKRYDARAA